MHLPDAAVYRPFQILYSRMVYIFPVIHPRICRPDSPFLPSSEPDISFWHLVQSGFNIGRDIMGTMANTLILAYIGSSLTTVLLYASYQASLEQLLNRELIIVELLQALSGSIGILCTIPISAFIASGLCCMKKRVIKKEA